MKTLPLRIAAALAVAVSFGCNRGTSPTSSGYVPVKSKTIASALLPVGQEDQYFPFVKGSQWTFDSETSRVVAGRREPAKKQEVTYKLSEVLPSADGGKDAWFQVFTDGVMNDREVWRITKSGIYQVALGSGKPKPLSKPQVVLPFPVKIAGTFKWNGIIKADNGESRESSLDGTVEGEELIDTAMGSFKALAIETRGTLKAPHSNSQLHTRIWLIPKVGIGRYLLEVGGKVSDPKVPGRTVEFLVVQLMKLKNYSPAPKK